MTRHWIGILALAGLLASSAMADEPMTPGTSSDDSPEVTAVVETWLDRAEGFRTETQDLSHLWQEGSAVVPPVTSASYVTTAEEFVMFTEEHSQSIRELAPDNDAACILHGIGLDVTERLEAYNVAEGVDGHVDVLNGIDRLIYEGLLIFGRVQEARGGGFDETIVIRPNAAPKAKPTSVKMPQILSEDELCGM